MKRRDPMGVPRQQMMMIAAVCALATAQAAVASTHALRIVGPPLYAEPNVIATERGDPEWDRTVADTIRALRADGTLTRISRKWFGQDITANEP